MTTRTAQPREHVTIERTYTDVTLEEVWDMWTTTDWIESWWGPDGFSVKVRTLDVRPGGTLVYAMTAVDPPQIEFMKNAGMPLTTETRGAFTVVDPPRRLSFTQVADFIPGVDPYEITTTVELHAVENGVRLVLALERMHDSHWTEMAVKGWTNELEKLAAALAA
ncbi:MAG: SRPBCC family protein [Gemmatimonadaceae bacterium]